MKKYILVIYMMAAGCTMLTAQTKNTQTLMPLTERVNVQADSARINQIIDGCWVAVGTNKPHAIQRDFTNLFDGKPSYRFELKTEDNTLEGYAKGETKGRAEFSYCYATSDDFRDYLPTFIRKHRSQRLFIITGRELVRKEVPATMSFRFIFLLLWTATSPPSLPNGTECPTGRWSRLLRAR